MEFKELEIKGRIMRSVYKRDSKDCDHAYENDAVIFTTTAGDKYTLTHQQYCCEHVYIEDICGDLSDLVGHPLLIAEEAYQEGETDEGTSTYSFYKFATIAGSVTIRFFGESNGYYCESAHLYKE